MSKWCNTCYRNEITGDWKSCNNDCPVFGKDFDELAKIVLSTQNKCGHIELIEPTEVKLDAQCCSCGIPMGSEDNYCPNCGKQILK